MRGKWKRRGIALCLALVVLMGSWGGLLAAWHSARGMGQQQEWLPHISFGADGGLVLTLGTKKWQLEQEKIRQGAEKADKVAWLVPRSLRITALGALAGAFWWKENIQPAAAKSLV